MSPIWGTNFVGSLKALPAPIRWWIGMACTHDGFHGIHSSYDQRRGLLVFFWSCERCGARLREVRREEYRPRFDPRGNEQHAGSLR